MLRIGAHKSTAMLMRSQGLTFKAMLFWEWRNAKVAATTARRATTACCTRSDGGTATKFNSRKLPNNAGIAAMIRVYGDMLGCSG